MHITATAIVCAVLAHGEHGAIARLLTPEDGLKPGYVRGGRSRRLRPILQGGNLVRAEFRARTESQLAALTVELIESRAALLGEPLAALAIGWVTAVTAVVLPEGQPYPRLFEALDGVLAAIASAPAARDWAGAVVRYEVLLLAELGFGLDLSACAATGARDDLAYVSPRSAAAVSRAAGRPYADRLLPLPAFVTQGGEADWRAVADGFRLTGHFLERDLLVGRAGIVIDARRRLVDRVAALA